MFRCIRWRSAVMCRDSGQGRPCAVQRLRDPNWPAIRKTHQWSALSRGEAFQSLAKPGDARRSGGPPMSPGGGGGAKVNLAKDRHRALEKFFVVWPTPSSKSLRGAGHCSKHWRAHFEISVAPITCRLLTRADFTGLLFLATIAILIPSVGTRTDALATPEVFTQTLSA